MPHKQPEFTFGAAAIITTVVGAVFGMLGGVAKHLADIQEEKAVFTWIGIFTQAFISAFVGALVTLYMLENDFSLYMILLGSGLAGFGGVVLLRFATSKVYQHFGADDPNKAQAAQGKKEVKNDVQG